ncbi:uncharacterized protein LOC108914193 isoform X2 [Anoplophora glabripennis]|nr:uncharacterized protein LOC108914193 isoform X2 [Anoplophora glabripennis]XP_023312218.1 uncharacterized protein LOC108914193 isoform X2 [Anoplophora glabripennis]
MNEWHDNIKSYFKTDVKLLPHFQVCALHFKKEFFSTGLTGQRIRLKNNAVPTIFENYGWNEQSQELEKSGLFQYKCEAMDIDADPENIPNPSDNVNLEKSCVIISNQSLKNLESNEENVTIDEFEKPYLKSQSLPSSLEDNKLEESLGVPSKTVEEKLWQKSIANIDLNAIDYKDEFLVRKLLEKSKMEIIQLRKSRRLQTLKLYRANKKIRGVGGLLSRVKEQGFISEKVSEILDATVPAETRDMFLRLLEKPKGRYTFPHSLRKFATNLHFYSPKAYNYVRQLFVKCLPHPLTISKWYRTIDCSSGINLPSIETLRMKVEYKKLMINRYCAI